MTSLDAGRGVTNTYLKALDVKIQAEGLNDHSSAFAQGKPARRAELLPTYRPRVQNTRHSKMRCLESGASRKNEVEHGASRIWSLMQKKKKNGFFKTIT